MGEPGWGKVGRGKKAWDHLVQGRPRSQQEMRTSFVHNPTQATSYLSGLVRASETGVSGYGGWHKVGAGRRRSGWWSLEPTDWCGAVSWTLDF